MVLLGLCFLHQSLGVYLAVRKLPVLTCTITYPSLLCWTPLTLWWKGSLESAGLSSHRRRRKRDDLTLPLFEGSCSSVVWYDEVQVDQTHRVVLNIQTDGSASSLCWCSVACPGLQNITIMITLTDHYTQGFHNININQHIVVYFRFIKRVESYIIVVL